MLVEVLFSKTTFAVTEPKYLTWMSLEVCSSKMKEREKRGLDIIVVGEEGCTDELLRETLRVGTGM